MNALVLDVVGADRGLYNSDDELEAVIVADHARAAQLLPLVSRAKLFDCRRAVWAAFEAARCVAAGEVRPPGVWPRVKF
jgi:hypothetical protein